MTLNIFLPFLYFYPLYICLLDYSILTLLFYLTSCVVSTCYLPYYLNGLKYALPSIVHHNTLWFKIFSKSLKYAESNTLLPSSYLKKFSKSLKYAESNTLLPSSYLKKFSKSLKYATAPYPFPLPFTPSPFHLPLPPLFTLPPSWFPSAILVSVVSIRRHLGFPSHNNNTRSYWRAASGGELLAGAYFPIEQMALQWSHTKLLLMLLGWEESSTLGHPQTSSSYCIAGACLRGQCSVDFSSCCNQFVIIVFV